MNQKTQKITMPDMRPIKSSSISHIGHHDDTLFVTFAKGKTYRYPGVSAEKFNTLLKAESAGRYLQKHVIAHHKGFAVTKDGE